MDALHSAPTRFTELTGCRVPIQLAVMGGIVDPTLAGAVGREGGLAMLSGTMEPEPELIDAIERTRGIAGADAPVGVGFLMPFLDPTIWANTADHADLVEGFYGDPDAELVAVAHERDALVSWQIGSVEEARLGIDTGCDLLVVQGIEAGGHVRGTVQLDDLLASVRAITELPLVASGGIGTVARAVELLDAGADGIRLGTRFLACTEADVHPDYLAALIEADAQATELTETFSFAWPHAPHRVLTSCIGAGTEDPALRSPLPPDRSFEGDVASAALYAGRSVGAVTAATTVAEVFAEFLGG